MNPDACEPPVPGVATHPKQRRHHQLRFDREEHRAAQSTPSVQRRNAAPSVSAKRAVPAAHPIALDRFLKTPHTLQDPELNRANQPPYPGISQQKRSKKNQGSAIAAAHGNRP